MLSGLTLGEVAELVDETGRKPVVPKLLKLLALEAFQPLALLAVLFSRLHRLLNIYLLLNK